MNNAEHIRSQQERLGRISDSGDFPKVVLIDTVSFCNLKCSMCVHPNMKRQRGRMNWDLFTKIIDEIASVDKNVRVWLVFFGEALLLKKTDPTIFKMIQYAKGKGLTDVVINSNANLLDDETARNLIQSGLDAIYIGLDAATEQTYEQLRIGGKFDQTVRNVIDLTKAKTDLRSPTPEIIVQFVEMDINSHEKNEFISFWKQYPVNVKIRPMVSWAGLIDAPNLMLTNDDRWPCYWAMQTMSITDQGDVVTCAVDLDARFVAGNVVNNSLQKIWNGKLRELRELHDQRLFVNLPQNCRDCGDWQSARADYY